MDNDAWNQWAATVFDQQFAEKWEWQRDVIAQVIAEERKSYRAEIRRQIGDAVRELRDELILKRGHDNGVIDLPNPLMRRRYDAA